MLLFCSAMWLRVLLFLDERNGEMLYIAVGIRAMQRGVSARPEFEFNPMLLLTCIHNRQPQPNESEEQLRTM